MIVSYFLAQTFVPIMANWIMKVKHHKKKDGTEMTDQEEFAASGLQGASEHNTWGQKAVLVERADSNRDGKISFFEKIRARYLRFIDRMMPFRKPIVLAYILVVCALAALLMGSIGRDVLPKVNGGQFQVRLREPQGTRIEQTEAQTIKVINAINDMVGKENVSITSAFVGLHPQLFSTAPIFLWMAGPHEAVLQVALKEHYKTNLDA